MVGTYFLKAYLSHWWNYNVKIEKMAQNKSHTCFFDFFCFVFRSDAFKPGLVWLYYYSHYSTTHEIYYLFLHCFENHITLSCNTSVIACIIHWSKSSHRGNPVMGWVDMQHVGRKLSVRVQLVIQLFSYSLKFHILPLGKGTQSAIDNMATGINVACPTPFISTYTLREGF